MKKITLLSCLFLFFIKTKATVFMVSNTNSNGAGSLAAAIDLANSDASASEIAPHIIDFSTLGITDNQIIITDQLQVIRPMIINGSTHSSGRITIDANGANVVCVNFFALPEFNADPAGSIVNNLTIINSDANGIEMNSVSNIGVENCHIGVDLNGTINSPVENGVFLFNGANDITVDNCLISGNNANGILIRDRSTNNITISNSIIGLDILGINAIPNSANGIHVVNSNSGVSIINNTISSNASNGVLFEGASNHSISGNIIGLGIDGRTRLGNIDNGIQLTSSSSNIRIGGRQEGNRNIISGNVSNGIFISESSDNRILGNFIGTDITGFLPIGNLQGVNIKSISSTNNSIGDTTFLGRNVISGNFIHGVFFEEEANNNEVIGNFIGTDSTGNNGVGNGHNGVSGTGSGANLVGGTNVNRRNVISGNGFDPYEFTLINLDRGPIFSGVSFRESTGLTVKGNYIGIGADGETEIPNANYGIWYFESTELTIGGSTEGERNIISGNGSLGLDPQEDQTINPEIQSSRGIYVIRGTGITITGNYVGTDPTGLIAKPNLSDGIVVIGSTDVTIGGAGGRSNLVSGNTFSGIYAYENTNIRIENNLLGLGSDGNTVVPNGLDGLYLFNQDNAVITGNTSSGNGQTGIHLFQSESNQLSNNTIGFSLDGNSPLGNTDGGIRILGVLEASSNNQIRQNRISNTTGSNTGSTIGDGYGIYVGGNLSINNLISENSIYCNRGLTIDLGIDGSGFGTNQAGNNAKIAPVIDPVLSTTTVTVGISNPGDTIQVYTSPSACGCDAEIFLGTVITEGDGTWSFSHSNLDSTSISIIAIDSEGNTSEVACKIAQGGEVNNIADNCLGEEIEIISTGHKSAALEWQISDESNFSSILFDTVTVGTIDPISIFYTPENSGQFFVRTIAISSPVSRDTSEVVSWNILETQEIGNLQRSSAALLCNGEEVIINIENDIVSSYEWFDSTALGIWQLIENETGASITVSPEENTFYMAIPATGMCVNSSDTILVEVQNLIIGSASISVNNLVCEGTLQEFETTINNVGESVTYEWFVNGLLVSEEIDYSSSALNNGDIVRLVVTADTTCPSTPTVSSNTIEIELITPLNPTISINGETELCSGVTAEYFATINEAGVNPNIEWFLNGNLLDQEGEVIMLSDLESNDSITAILTPEETCVINSPDTSNALILLEVEQSTEGSVTIAPDTNDVCENTEIVVIPTPMNVGSGATYEWSINGSLISREFNLSSDDFNNGDIVSLVVRPDSRCSLSDEIRSNQVTIEITDLVTPSIRINGNTDICSGDESEFSVTTNNGGPNPEIRWFINGDLLDQTTETIILSNTENNDRVTATLISDETCVTTNQVQSNEISIRVREREQLAVSIDEDYQRCLDLTGFVNLRAESSLNTDLVDFEWFVNGEAQSNNSMGFAYIPSSGDIITVSISSEVECLTSNTDISDPLALEFSNSVVANAAEDIQILLNEDFTLDGSGSRNVDAFQWQELINNGVVNLTSTVTYSESAIEQEGVREFILVTSNEFCEDRDSVLVSIMREPVDIFIPNAFSPNNDENHDLWIIEGIDFFPSVEVRVYNRWGSLVFESDNYSISNAWNGTSNGGDLPVSTYYYVVDLKNNSEPVSGYVNILR